MQRRLLEAGLHGRYVPDAEVWHWIPADRCSRRWVLHRAYRDGIKYGLQAKLPADTVPACGAIPATRFEALPSRRSGRSCAASIRTTRRDSGRDESGWSPWVS